MITEARRVAVSIELKVRQLQGILRDCGSVCIGYSGGVDSVFLATVAVDVLGSRNVLAVTGRSAAYPQVQRDVAIECAERFGIPHLEVDTDELSDPNYAANPSNRCYYCKSELWPKLRDVARARGLRSVLDGSNADDAGDYRPGFAAARENGVRSPLLEAGLTKDEVRTLSRARGLPTWDQPASPCLSSRLPYGVAVTAERLAQVERAEAALRSLGYREFRVRHHDDCLRLEFAGAELNRAWAEMPRIEAAVAAAGGARVVLDVEGYRRGALNEVLVQLGGGRSVAPASGSGGRDAHRGDPTPVEAVEPGRPRVPAHARAGHHGDIAVLSEPSLEAARNAVPTLRELGFRYVAVEAARPGGQAPG